MKNATLLFLPLLLGACATASTGADDKDAFVVKCSAADLEACYGQASARCPGGYTILGNPDTGGVGVMAPGGNAALFARGPNKLIARCK